MLCIGNTVCCGFWAFIFVCAWVCVCFAVFTNHFIIRSYIVFSVTRSVCIFLLIFVCCVFVCVVCVCAYVCLVP